MKAEQEQQEQENNRIVDDLRENYLIERKLKSDELLETMTENELSQLKSEFEKLMLETDFIAKIYKTKGFGYGAIQVERRKFLIEKFLPFHLHSFENYVRQNGEAGGLSD